MKPPPFGYLRPSNLEDALLALASDSRARPLAGGQSLIPLLNVRAIRPTMLVDLNGLSELAQIDIGAREVVLGSLTRHRTLERDRAIVEALPALAVAIGHVGSPQVRNRGTLGGSLAHADPSGEPGALALLLEATITLRGMGHTRDVALEELLVAPFAPALEPGELVTSIRLRRPDPSAHWGFREIAARTNDSALALAAALVKFDGGSRVEHARVVAAPAAGYPVRLHAVEDALLGREQRINRRIERALEALEREQSMRLVTPSRRAMARVALAAAIRQAAGTA